MEIDIERLDLQVAGGDFSAQRGLAIGELIGAALEELLHAYGPELAAAPAGYRVPAVPVPSLAVRAGAGDDEIAQEVARALARAILAELEL